MIHPKTNSNITQLQIQIAKVKVLQNLIASRVELSCQNSKDLVEQSGIASPSTDDFPYQCKNPRPYVPFQNTKTT